jgi:hypothetical protein
MQFLKVAPTNFSQRKPQRLLSSLITGHGKVNKTSTQWLCINVANTFQKPLRNAYEK